MILESLSEAGLFYFPNLELEAGFAVLSGSVELAHLHKVLRKKQGEFVYVTDGRGKLVAGSIVSISNDFCKISVIAEETKINPLGRVIIALPILKNPDRLEFALEKCIELGFSQFVFVKYDHSVKTSVNLLRMEQKGIAAMKQSLNLYKPSITYSDSFFSIGESKSEIILFDLNAALSFEKDFSDNGGSYLLAIGPEGGFSASEIEYFSSKKAYKLAGGRLRAETAVVVSASLLANKLLFQ